MPEYATTATHFATSLAGLAGTTSGFFTVWGAVIATLSLVLGGGFVWKFGAWVRRNIVVEDARPLWLEDMKTLKAEMLDREKDMRSEMEGRERLWETRFAHMENRILPAMEDMATSSRKLAESVGAQAIELAKTSTGLQSLKEEVSRLFRPPHG